MNIKEIREMIDLMNKNDLKEFELEKDGMKIRLKKSGGSIQQEMLGERISLKPAPQALRPQAAETKQKKTLEIKSPMVGTFYRAASPDAPSFIDIGAVVEPGQVVCIIEAMKLMNEIKSDVKGKVVDILAQNGNPVEFGQALFVVEPTV